MSVTPRNELADFHVHFNGSIEDGIEVIDRAARCGASIIAMLEKQMATEPKVVKVLREYGEKKKVEVLSGMELVAVDEGREDYVDLIAIGIDTSSTSISDWLSKEAKQIARKERMAGIKVELEEMGFTFPPIDNGTEDDDPRQNELFAGLNTSNGLTFGKILWSASSNGQKLNTVQFEDLKNEYPRAWNKTKQKCFTPESNYTEKKPNFDEEYIYGTLMYHALFDVGQRFTDRNHANSTDTIQRIHTAGGLAFYSPEGKFEPDLMEQLILDGIDGIFAYHGTKMGYEIEEAEGHRKISIPSRYLRSYRERGLLILGGSDFQGKDWEVGSGIGDMAIRMDQKRYEKLRERLATVRRTG